VSASAKLRLWDVEELQASATPGDLSQTQRAHGVEALAVAGEVLAAVTSSGDVRRWLWRSGQELAPLQVDDLDVAGIRGVTIENENAVVVAHQSGLVETFDAETGQRDPVSLSAGEKLLCFAVVPLEGRPVAATAVQLGIEQDIGGPRAFHGVRLWDLATGVEIDTRHARADLRSSRESLAWKLVPPRSDRRIDVIEASTGPADAVIAVGSARAVTTWSMSDLGREGSVSRSYTTSALALRGSRLAIADSRGTIEVWDVHRLAGASIGERIAEHPGVTSLLLARWRGMAALLSGGTDRCLRVWSPDGGTIEVIEIDEPVTSLAELPDGHLAVGTRRGLMVLSIG
jgi:WD40 repeat protein